MLRSEDLHQLTYRHKVLRTYDPGYTNTIACDSSISFIDGNKGILEYRGYSIQSLCERANFIETAFLILFGELPTPVYYHSFEKKVRDKMFLHSDMENMMKNFRYDSHPMGIMCSSLAALSTFYPENNPSVKGENLYENRNVRLPVSYTHLTLPTIYSV